MATSRMSRIVAVVALAVGPLTAAHAESLTLTPRSIVNQSGTTVESGGMRWLGTGANAALSRLGVVFSAPALPTTALRSARLVVTAAWTQWIPVDVAIAAVLDPAPADFGPHALPSERSLTAPATHYAENTRWGANSVYAIDVTAPVRALLERYARPAAIALVAAGQGTAWGRKYFATGTAVPRLELAFDDPPAPAPVALPSPAAAAPAAEGAPAASR